MYGLPQAASDVLQPAMLAELDAGDTLRVEHGDRKFFAPVSAKELAALLADFPDATLLAGGTDVGLWVTKQYQVLDVVIYTGRIAELGRVEETATHIEIGAAVTLSESMLAIIAIYPDLEELFPALCVTTHSKRGDLRRQYREWIANRRFDAGTHGRGHHPVATFATR